MYLVGSAGGPIGGDCLRLDVCVGAGATLVVRSAAASLALPGRGGEPSSFTVHARVAGGAALVWSPEPTIAAAGCRHTTRVVLEAAGSATVCWRDTVVLGRDGEPAGWIASELHVDVDHRPRLRHTLALGAGARGAAGPAVIGDAPRS